LQERVARGEFRSDLYYRLAVIELQLPTLEERGVIDKIAIFKAVTDEILGPSLKLRLGDPPSWLIEAVAGIHFPGNVRQLRSLSERLGVIARQTGRWDRSLCERALHSAGNISVAPAASATTTRRAPDAQERQRLIDALEAHDWRRQETARQLGISRKALWERMRKYQIQGAGTRAA
ncbi:MAG: sigma-54-dependent Fis family transcriptional regulator, partial [Burkholderiales bacterium]